MSDTFLPDNIEANLPNLPNLISTPRSAQMSLQQNPSPARDDDFRRDSSSSNDSQSCKKIASLNEIEDLYSALQDLVKTNVSNVQSTPLVKGDIDPPVSTTTPLVKGDIDRPVSTPINGNKEGSQNLNHNSLQRIRSNSYTSPIIDTYKKVFEKKTVFRRAATTNGFGNFKSPPINMRRISSHPPLTRQDNIDDNNKVFGKRKTGRSISVGGPNRQNLENLVDQSEVITRENKKWKDKILSRIRSKTSALKHKDISEENGNSFEENRNSFGKGDNRRYSENDCEKVFCEHPFNLNDGNNLDKANVVEDLEINVKDIDKLVEALNLEMTDSPTTRVADTSNKSAESELSKLECWFEKAAAEAVMRHSRGSSDYDNDSDRRTPPNNRDMRRRTINRNKKSTLKRNKSIHDPVKRERRMRQVLPNEDYVSNNVNSFVRLQHAKSTPDLRDPDIFCDSDNFRASHDYSRDSYDSDILHDDDYINLEETNTPSKEIKCFDTNTVNNVKSDSPKLQKTRRISLEENIRLPKTPLFYTPSNDNLEMVTEIDIVGERNSINDKKNNNRPFSMPNGNQFINTLNGSELNEFNKMRPKSLCSSSSSNDFLCNDSKGSWSSTNGDSGNIPNSISFGTGDHSGYCESRSLSDISTDSVVQNHKMWGNFLNENENQANTASKFYTLF